MFDTLHNAIMEAGSKDCPPMLASGWKDKEVPTSEGSPITRTEKVHETYKNVSQEIRDQLNVKAETGESINVQDLEANLYWEFGKFTSRDGELLESYCSRNRGKAIINSLQPIYDQEPSMVAEDDETSKDKEIDKLMALISLSSVGYENQRISNVVGARETIGSTVEEAGIQLNAKQADWREDTDDDELEDQELEAHYMYMAQLQEVSPDAADSGAIFDDEPLQKVSNDDHYNVFAIESAHPEQSKPVHDTYPLKHDAQNVIIDSLDIKSSNNYFKEVNNRLSETNNLLYADYKKSKAELARHNSKEYASTMELEGAKVKGDFLSYKMEYQKSYTKYIDTINDLNQMISEMKDKLSAHQETISILSQQKEAQIKLYKTREDKELDKVIELEQKVKEKGKACIFVGYSTQSRAYQVYNKRTKVIIQTIHVNFDELPQMELDHVSSDPVPQCLTTALEHDSLSPSPQSQENVPHTAETVTTSNELDLLFCSMFDELLNGTTPVVLKTFAINTVDAPDQRQQQNTTPSTTTTVAADIPSLNIQTTPETTNQAPTQAPTVTATANIIQVETNKEYA
nr:hypothetical protein [Tanacetum cinerariifolium]